MIKCIVITLLLLGYEVAAKDSLNDVSKVALQDCFPKDGACDLDLTNGGCCTGFYCYNSFFWGPYCTCSERGFSEWPTCYSDNQCCIGHGPCNSLDYCGCIGNNFPCTQGRSDECCDGRECKLVQLWSYTCQPV